MPDATILSSTLPRVERKARTSWTLGTPQFRAKAG
jgi:hypothetical protein